jgi:hypothetical protein
MNSAGVGNLAAVHADDWPSIFRQNKSRIIFQFSPPNGVKVKRIILFASLENLLGATSDNFGQLVVGHLAIGGGGGDPNHDFKSEQRPTSSYL